MTRKKKVVERTLVSSALEMACALGVVCSIPESNKTSRGMIYDCILFMIHGYAGKSGMEVTEAVAALMAADPLLATMKTVGRREKK